MGYTTTYFGRIDIAPALNRRELDYLIKFNLLRHVLRAKGPYYVDGAANPSPARETDIINWNVPDRLQPDVYCHWRPTPDGAAITWDGSEKFYNGPEWMKYLIDHFLKPDCLAKRALPFLQANHVLNGELEAHGERSDDVWWLIVKDNRVGQQKAGPPIKIGNVEYL